MDVIREVNVKSILGKSGIHHGYSANPYVGCTHDCIYCFAAYMQRYSNHEEKWGTFLDVKNWPPLKQIYKLDGASIWIGSVTDGYNSYEAKYKRTRLLLEQLQGADVDITICTKSDLVLRDLDLLKKFRRATISWSINTVDEALQAQMDKAAPISKRLEAMRIAHEAGIHTICFIAPILPQLTSVPAIVAAVKDRADEIWLDKLNLRGQVRTPVLKFIGQHYPELLPLYKALYPVPTTLQSRWQQMPRDLALQQQQRMQRRQQTGVQMTTIEGSFSPPASAGVTTSNRASTEAAEHNDLCDYWESLAMALEAYAHAQNISYYIRPNNTLKDITGQDGCSASAAHNEAEADDLLLLGALGQGQSQEKKRFMGPVMVNYFAPRK